MNIKETTELTDEELEQVVGGARRTVWNDHDIYIKVYNSPNGETDYKLRNGSDVYTTGRRVEIDGIKWVQLNDGCWIQAGYLD